MTSLRFTEKLDTLPDTLALMRGFQRDDLRDALERARTRRVMAVGAGGSYVSAAYLATCRRTLGHAATVVQTPMEAVVDCDNLQDAEVWIFSASANNADAAAVAHAARDRGCASLVLCTRSPDGSVARWIREHGGEVLVFPVAVLKDGYLASHSLIASVVGIFLAAEDLGDVQSESSLDVLIDSLNHNLNPKVRANRQQEIANLTNGATIIAIIDPLLMPLRALIETSIWEAAICPIQVTDMRNFGHGRHSWLHHYGDQTWIFTATGILSRVSWEVIHSAMPEQTPVIVNDYGSCGRLETAKAVIDGLGWIEAMGANVGIDPGKPGTGEFAGAMYDDESLNDLAVQLSPPIRQKLSAAVMRGTRSLDVAQTANNFNRYVRNLCNTDIGGLVLDYDGTVVTTEGRFEPADAAIVKELVRIHSLGVVIAFASGRGKSLGRDLRRVLPRSMAAETVVGYYNGGHLRMASVDIDATSERPEPNSCILEIAHWMETQPNLLRPCNLELKEVQVTVNKSDILRPHTFVQELCQCSAIAEGRAAVVASAHSYDVIPSTSSKLRVLEVVTDRVGTDRAVVSIGDSGAQMGNDHALISGPYGVSVGAISDDPAGCWSLFGTLTTGPAALLRILKAVVPLEGGGIRLCQHTLDLDARRPNL